MNHKIKSMWIRLMAFLLAAAVITLTGCKIVPPDALSSFASGITTARTQSQEAFNAVNELVADVSLDYAASQTNLLESSFAAGLDEESLAAWDEILEKLEKYGQHLQLLTSPDLAGSFDDEAVNLSGELKNFGQHLQGAGLINKSPEISPAIATGFTKLGELIIRLRAEARARKVLADTDAEIGRILATMAGSVGNSRTNGIRGTVTSHWTQLLGEKKVAFRSQPDQAGRRQVAADFRKFLKRRSAQDLVLLSLRRSLLQLADLHHALARGERWSVQSAADAIADEIKRTRDLNGRFQDELKNQ